MAQPPLAPPMQPPPVGGRLTASELIPLGSTRISLLRSRALIPLTLTAIVCVALFGFLRQMGQGGPIEPYFQTLAVFLVVLIFFALYAYSGETKTIFWYLIPAGFTYWQLSHTFGYYAYVFRQLLPGDTRNVSGFAQTYAAHFFGAGLCEEMLKAAPALIGLVLAWILRARSGPSRTGIARFLCVEGPLDGLLIGLAAGAAFIVDETVFDYVARTVKSFRNVSQGQFFGLALLIPRVLQGVIGHMAWAGIFGYFIGLSATHPRDAWKLLPVGLLVAAALHAFWNSVDAISIPYGLYLSAALTLPVFFSCLMKARQLEAVRLGLPIDGRSILPGSVPVGGLAGLTSLIERSVGVTARATMPLPSVAARPGMGPGLAFAAGERAYAIVPGQVVDFAGSFAPAGLPEGSTGIVGATPDGALCVRNAGASTWTVIASDGGAATVMPGASFRPSAGTRLAVGEAAIVIKAF